MKKLAVLLLFLGLILAGCSDLGTNAPLDNPQATNKTNGYEFVKLPANNDAGATAVERTFWTGRFIIGHFGGNIPMFRLYWSDNGIVTVQSDLEIPAQAFNGLKLIYYSVDSDLAVADFNPEMTFNKDLNFTLKFTNIDLSGITNPDQIEFAYLDGNNQIQIAEYDELTVDLESGTLEVINAKIGHFSRYGFVR